MENNYNRIKKIGLIVNPIAGMGGSVGLKGTDGDIHRRAREMGATPVASERVRDLLSHIKKKEGIYFLVAPSIMGANYVKDQGFKFKIIGKIGEQTTSEDTKRIANEMVEKTIDLLIFCGGDGTARDIFDAIGLKKPVVALPVGVKMFSSVFALNPRAAAQIIDKFIDESIESQEKEVLDIDEESFREDILQSRLYGYLKVPKVLDLIQSGKSSSRMGKTVEENKQEIAQFIIDEMQKDTLYLLGPGTTVKAINDRLNLPKTLLGIDAIYNKNNVGEDLNEKGILELISFYPNTEIIVSPIGGQGFIFGRGNKQFTPDILKLVGKKKIRIIATSDKMRELKCLRVDSGDFEVDNQFKGFTKVVIGYKEEIIIQIEC